MQHWQLLVCIGCSLTHAPLADLAHILSLLQRPRLHPASHVPQADTRLAWALQPPLIAAYAWLGCIQPPWRLCRLQHAKPAALASFPLALAPLLQPLAWLVRLEATLQHWLQPPLQPASCALVAPLALLLLLHLQVLHAKTAALAFIPQVLVQQARKPAQPADLAPFLLLWGPGRRKTAAPAVLEAFRRPWPPQRLQSASVVLLANIPLPWALPTRQHVPSARQAPTTPFLALMRPAPARPALLGRFLRALAP